MKKVLTLSNEQARTLYDLISGYEIPDRSANRKRFRFLEVMEYAVDKYADGMKVFQGKKIRDVRDEIDELSDETTKFVFNDREIFAVVKDMFEKSFAVGTVSMDERGKVTRSPLTGRNAKIYMELEDAFADVKEIKEKK